MAKSNLTRTSLPRHRDHEAFFGTDFVVDVLGSSIDIDLHPVDFAVELIAIRTIIPGDGLAYIATDVQCFIHREEERMRVTERRLVI